MNKLAITILLIASHLSHGQEYDFTSSVPADFEIQDGKATLTFKIAVLGWEETHKSVAILDSYFQVSLGSITPLDKVDLEVNADIIQAPYGYEGAGVMVDIYHKGQLISKEPLFLDGGGSIGPRVEMPEIIEIPDEEEIEEEIEIDMDVEITEETMVEDLLYEEPIEKPYGEVFSVVSEMPSYPEGQEALNQYIAENLKYPSQAKRMGIEGRVYVEFVVTKTGKVVDANVLKGIGARCDEEAVRIINSLKDFIPGKQQDEAVNVRMVHPITFKI